MGTGSQEKLPSGDIPEKLFFKIGEVCQLVGVEAHVLRYWEQEFLFSSQKTPTGQRRFRRKDVERFRMIRRLLYDDGFTIAGARKVLGSRLRASEKSEADDVRCVDRIVPEQDAEKLADDFVKSSSIPTSVASAEAAEIRTTVNELLSLIKAAKALSE